MDKVEIDTAKTKPGLIINSGTELAKKFLFEGIVFVKQNNDLLLAGLIALFSLFYFLVTAYSDVFEEVFFGFRIRIFGLAIGLIVSVLSFLAAYFTHQNYIKKVLTFLQSLLLLFFSFSYFLSIENRNFYPIILAVLPAFLFFIHLTLFTGKWVNVYTTLAQVLLFSLQTFSFLTFFDADRVAARNFSQDFLAVVFNLPEFFWLTISAFAISIVSVNYFKLEKIKYNFGFLLLNFWLIIQILYTVESITFQNFFYWEKMIVFLIMWDFLLAPLAIIASKVQDDKYRPRLAVSTIYHIFLLVLVFIFVLI